MCETYWPVQRKKANAEQDEKKERIVFQGKLVLCTQVMRSVLIITLQDVFKHLFYGGERDCTFISKLGKDDKLKLLKVLLL